MIHVFNLDPASDQLAYTPSKNIRDFTDQQSFMEQESLGPNGALMAALEHAVEHSDWLDEDLGEYSDEFILVDFPGQIEIFTCSDIVTKFIKLFEGKNYQVMSLYLMDSHFICDSFKYFSALLNATITMLNLGIPHLNIITKMDLMEREYPEQRIEDIAEETHPLHRYFFPSPLSLANDISLGDKNLARFITALANIIEDCDIVSFLPHNINNENSLEDLLSHIDNAVQYGEQLEPREPTEPTE